MAAAYQLDTCVWEITRACNFSCAHCGSSAGRAREGELTTDEALSVADQLVDLGCRRVVLIGGEAFMRPDWDVIARRLVDGGVEASIITNGSCFTEHVWQRMEAAGVRYVAVSIDGNEAHHDALRMPGSYRHGMEALAQAHARGLATAAITVLNAGNADDLPELYDALAAIPVDAWQIQLCSPFGNARHESGLVPSIEQVAGAVDFIARQNRACFAFDRAEEGAPGNQQADWQDEVPSRPPLRIFAADNIGYHTADEGVIRGYPGMSFQGCAAGISAIGIDSVGNVRGCESLYDEAFNEGNLRERTLRDIWESPDAFAYNRQFRLDMLSGSCARCAYGARCAGGCRSLNHFLAGNMYEAPRCVRAHMFR